MGSVATSASPAHAIERAACSTVRVALGDRAIGACATGHDNALNAHDRPTTVYNVLHCLDNCSWTLFHENCSWAL